jgi:hypothetical protein
MTRIGSPGRRLTIGWLVGVAACSAGGAGPPGSVDSIDASTTVSQDAGAPGDARAASDAIVDAARGVTTIDAGVDAATDGLGAAAFGAGDLDPASNGGTITFEQIGATGWYPSRRDPAQGPCDAYDSGTCCLATDTIASDALTPWDEELVMTLRGPMRVKQFAVYQPDPTGGTWDLTSGWDDRRPTSHFATAFSGDATPNAAFAGSVGSECLVNVATARPFPCGSGSDPYCPSGAATNTFGWSGSKLFVLLAKMDHAGTSGAPSACSTTTTGNWYDAPWIGLAVGELARAGSFASCQCYAKAPSNSALADGCGQFNVFEVVNDNNQYKNLDVFSTDMIDYAGYVGQGPCGSACDVAALGPEVDLIDKTNDSEATTGPVATPAGGPSAAFRRPESGYRYFLILLDVASRTVQLGIVHPDRVPGALTPILPALPPSFPAATESALLGLRLPM